MTLNNAMNKVLNCKPNELDQAYIELNKAQPKELVKFNIDQALDYISVQDFGNRCFFGIEYFDACFNGISQNDFVVLAGSTGVGKTELALQIAKENSRLGKKVKMVMLEAELNEGVDRLRFQAFATEYYKFHNKPVFYDDYKYGNYENEYAKIFERVKPNLVKTLENLDILYRCSGEFGAKELEEFFLMNQENTDLFIIDHLHYFDFDDDNENRAVKKLMKTMRDLVLIYNKPIVLIAHIRKLAKNDTSLIPNVNDIMGSSDISKISTKIGVLSSYYGEGAVATPVKFPTLFSAQKNRRLGSVVRYGGIQLFDITKNQYEKEVVLGKFNKGLDKLELCSEEQDLPSWAKERLKNGITYSSNKRSDTSTSSGLTKSLFSKSGRKVYGGYND